MGMYHIYIYIYVCIICIRPYQKNILREDQKEMCAARMENTLSVRKYSVKWVCIMYTYKYMYVGIMYIGLARGVLTKKEEVGGARLNSRHSVKLDSVKWVCIVCVYTCAFDI